MINNEHAMKHAWWGFKSYFSVIACYSEVAVILFSNNCV